MNTFRSGTIIIFLLNLAFVFPLKASELEFASECQTLMEKKRSTAEEAEAICRCQLEIVDDNFSDDEKNVAAASYKMMNDKEFFSKRDAKFRKLSRKDPSKAGAMMQEAISDYMQDNGIDEELYASGFSRMREHSRSIKKCSQTGFCHIADEQRVEELVWAECTELGGEFVSERDGRKLKARYFLNKP
jgi:hypothetical protein